MTVPISSLEKNKRDAVVSRALLPWAIAAGLFIFGLVFFMALAPVVVGLVLPFGAVAGLVAVVLLAFMVLVGCFFARDTLLSIPHGAHVGWHLTKPSSRTEPSPAALRGPFIPPGALT